MSSPPPQPQPSAAIVNDVDSIDSQTANLSLSSGSPPPQPQQPPMGLTENLSPTFLATGNPCLDFFFHVVPDTPPSDLISRLELAWTFDPLTTLKLICNLRGVRGTGKSDKEGFYGSALWLFRNHPKTLTMNLNHIAEFGYFKDLPEILYRIVEGSDCRQIAKEAYESRKRKGYRGTRRERRVRRDRVSVGDDDDESDGDKDRPAAVVIDKETARVLRKEKESAKLKKAVEKYSNDLDYRNLHDGVAKLFAELLKLDVGHLSSGELHKISLAAKWCPSIDRSYDKSTLICSNIAKLMFGEELFGEAGDAYVSRAKGWLKKKVLVPLRRALDLPEVYMSANEWSELKYNRVASVAMKNYKKLFVKHDKERFAEFLEDVKSGKAKIAAGALLPHQIIGCLNDEDDGEVAELQWNRMVDDMKKKGKLDNCIAVCDVSGSMTGIPMEVSVALGLLLSELSEEPWKGNVITFSAHPELHVIKGDTLKEKTEFIRYMDWGMNTDLQKVFDQLLKVAVNGNLSEEQMIKRVFIFSDMEFDEATIISESSSDEYKSASDEATEDDAFKETLETEDDILKDIMGTEDDALKETLETEEDALKETLETEDDTQNDDVDVNMKEEEEKYLESERKRKEEQRESWKTNYEVIKAKYLKQGYKKVPEIVFWNLRNSSATPVPCDQPGVALLSGFSKNLLTLFLEGGGIVSPVDVMHSAIAGEEYQKLAVFD